MSKVAGFVKQIQVDIGDRVEQGHLLAVIDVPEMQDDLAKSEAALKRYTAEVARARDELERARSAHEIADLSYKRLSAVMKSKPGLVAQQEVDDAHSRDLVAEAQIRAAQSALAASEEQVGVAKADVDKIHTLLVYTRVTAPFPGVVTKRNADTGSMIQAGTSPNATPLVRLSQTSLLRLILPVPESAVPHIRVGEPVEVRVPSLNRSFPGKVARFADKIQMSTRTMDTEVDVANPGLVLKPGMYAEVELRLEDHRNALSIPVTAVAGEEGKQKVYVVRNGRVEERKVTLGLETSSRVEVTAGLENGDLVVIGSRTQLKAGQRVNPKITELTAAKNEG